MGRSERISMMKHNYSFAKKATAVFLSAVIFAAMLAGMFGILYMAESDYYSSTLTQVQKADQTQMLVDKIERVRYLFLVEGMDPAEYFENTNFEFTIIDGNGYTVLSTYGGMAPECEESMELSDGLYTYTITGYVVPNGGEDIFAGRLSFVELLYQTRYTLIVLEFFAVCVFVVLLIFLFCAAGYRRGETKPRYGTMEKIPFDVFTVLYAAIGIFLGVLLMGGLVTLWRPLSIVVSALFFVLIYLLGLSYLLSFAIRLKVGGLVKNMLICRAVMWIFREFSAFFQRLPLIRKTVVCVVAVLLIDFIALVSFYHTSQYMLYWLIKSIIVVPIIFYIAVALRRLEKGGEQIAKGDLTYQIDTSHMIGDFKEFGNSLNSIREGMSRAVEERIKSERMKTELITNVSHDIKTPLTSIINYVDLIKKEPIESETLREYIAVLDRQSARLKKLIEDLVEASKASTGNLTVDMTPCDIGVLIQQAVGEYDEKLKNAKLEAIVTCPEEPVKIMADGRYMWRVIDNLMNNICKYSQNGTRIYLSLSEERGMAILTFKNISRYPLNISEEELMERFVRGDSSRSTEGSGLGLSIARSLTELQKGRLTLSIDGDLFKAVLTFPTI